MTSEKKTEPIDELIAQLPEPQPNRGNRQNIIPRPDGTPRRGIRPSKRSKPRGDYLSPRVRKAIQLIVFAGTRRDEAAAAVGMQDASLLIAFSMPKVRQFHAQCYEVLRTGLRAEGLHTIADLNRAAKSENVKLQAAKYLESEGQSDKQQVNVNVGVAVAPGYMIDIGSDTDELRRIAQQSGSTATIIDNKG